MSESDHKPALPPEAVPSPCVDVCRIEAGTGLCAGCWRSLEEIAAWRDAGAAEKRAILERVAARKGAAVPATD